MKQDISYNKYKLIAILYIGLLSLIVGAIFNEAFGASYLGKASQISSTTSSGNVQADITRLDLTIGNSTAEILAIQLNLNTHEVFLNELKDNLTTHETMLQALFENLSTHEDEIGAIRLNLGTLEDLINMKANIADVYTTTEINLALANKADTDSVYTKSAMDILLALKASVIYVNGTDEILGIRLDSIEAMLSGGISGEVLTRTNTGYIWATIPAGVTDHTLLSNIGTKTHTQLESDISALQAGVTVKAVKSTCLYYGYPIAINDYWDETKAAEFYSKYDIIVFGDEYQQTSHETHLSTVSIISKIKVANPDVEIFGYVPIGGTLGRNLTTAEIETAITEWNTTGATGVFLDEFGFDYMVTRERQNMAVDKAHSLNMNVIANAWTIDHVFNNDNGYCDWIPFYGNPNFVEAHINSNDYYLFENLFYYYESGTQKVEDQWRVYEAYRYYYDSAAQSTYGVNYYDTFHTKTIGLDSVNASNSSREKYYATAILGARALNLDAYCVSPINWGADSTIYPEYSFSLFPEEKKMFENTTKIQPLVETYGGKDVSRYTSTIENNIITLYWVPGATITNPSLGTHKAQINGIDRINAYTPSAASSSNTIGNLVMRDSNGDFSARVITGALTGNASTATKLATPRNINGIPFDGSADITLPVPESGLTKIYGDADSSGSDTGEITIKGDGVSTRVDRDGQTFEVKFIGSVPSGDAISNIYGGISDVSGTGTGEVGFYGSGAVQITRVGKTIEVYAPSSSATVDGITKIYGGMSDTSGITGEATFKAGTNVTITRTDGTIEISATGSSSSEEDASNMYQATLTDSYATLFTVGSTSRLLQLHIANTGASTRIVYLKFNNSIFLQKSLEPYQSISVTEGRFLIHTSYDNKITGKQDAGNDVVVTAYTVANTTDALVGGIETNGTSYGAFVTASGSNKKVKEIWMVNTYSAQIVCNISTTNSATGTIFKNIVIPANSFVVLQKLNMIVTDGNSLYWNSDTQAADRNIVAIGKTQ